MNPQQVLGQLYSECNARVCVCHAQTVHDTQTPPGQPAAPCQRQAPTHTWHQGRTAGPGSRTVLETGKQFPKTAVYGGHMLSTVLGQESYAAAAKQTTPCQPAWPKEAVPQEPGEACSLRSCPCSPASFGARTVDCPISHTFQVGFPAFTGGFYLFHSQYLKFWTLWTCCVNPQLPAAALLHGLALLYSWTHCGDTEVTSVRIPFCSTASENPSRAHQALYACRPLLLLTAQAQQQAYTHPKVALQLGMTNLTASQLLLIPLALSPHWQRLQGRVFKSSNLVYSSEQQQTAEQQDTRKTTTGTLKNEGLRGGQACVQQRWQKRCSGNLLPCTKPSPGSSAECKLRDCSEQQHGTQQTLLIAAFSKVDREQKAKSELLLASWCNLSRRKESCALATFYDCSIWVFKWTNWHNGISQKQIQPQHTSFAGGLFRLLLKELCLRATPLDQQEGAGSTNTKYCMAPRPQHLSCTTS